MIFKQAQRDFGSAALGILVLAGLAFGRGGHSSGDNDQDAPKGAVRIAYFPNVTHAPALVGVARGTFARDLPGYRVETKVVNAGPEAMEALLAKAIDFAYVGPSPAINTYLKSNGKALRILAAACTGGASLICRGDENIASVRDLDGKRVAVPQIGGTQDVSLRHFLAAQNLYPKERGGTVQIMPIANPDILALFKQKQIDAAWVPEPWASRLRDDAGGKTVVDERDLWPNHRFTTTVLVVRKEYQDEHPDVVAQVVRAHLATLAWLKLNPEEGQKITNAELKRLTGKQLAPSILKEAWEHVSFEADPNEPNLEAFAAAAREAGYGKAGSTTLDALVDHTALAVAESRP